MSFPSGVQAGQWYKSGERLMLRFLRNYSFVCVHLYYTFLWGIKVERWNKGFPGLCFVAGSQGGQQQQQQKIL